MAIQVGGTTVIDNSRNLQNVGGLKTINNTSILGSGNISVSSSTSNGSVGTYAFLDCATLTSFGTTRAGSTLSPASVTSYFGTYINGDVDAYLAVATPTQSGTWRCMGGNGSQSQYKVTTATTWVRIS